METKIQIIPHNRATFKKKQPFILLIYSILSSVLTQNMRSVKEFFLYLITIKNNKLYADNNRSF